MALTYEEGVRTVKRIRKYPPGIDRAFWGRTKKFEEAENLGSKLRELTPSYVLRYG